MLGILWLERGRAAEAVPVLREALRAEPRNLNVLDALARGIHGGWRLCAGGGDGAARGSPWTPAGRLAHLRLGMVLTRQGRWREATRAFEDAIERAAAIRRSASQSGRRVDQAAPPRGSDILFPARACDRSRRTPKPTTRWVSRYRGLACGAPPRVATSAPSLSIRHLRRRITTSPSPSCSMAISLAGGRMHEQRPRCEPVRATLRKRADTLDLYDRLPRWQGPSEAGAGEVAIWAEQGIGDQILFSTLIPELSAQRCRLSTKWTGGCSPRLRTGVPRRPLRRAR